MAVFAPNPDIGIDGLGESHAAFRESHESNSNQLLNLAEGRKKTDPRPAYNPNHPDNQWPQAVHHAAKGEKVVGRNLKGVADPTERKKILAANESEKSEALKLGYQLEPFVKPQVVVLSPEVEKAALIAKNKELEGQYIAANDMLVKMAARLEALEKKA